MKIWKLNIFILFFCVLIRIAFITLLERKILGLIQLRKGPNKVRILGIFQPFRDALKLFTKTSINPSISSKYTFKISPPIALSLIFFSWIIFPISFSTPNFSYRILFFLVISRRRVYPLVRRGWRSNRWYAVIGSYRAIAQVISYEINIALILLCLIFIHQTFNLSHFLLNNFIWLVIPINFLFLIWSVTSLAELHRTPFDFAECESELVSGFNTEFSRRPFALIYLAEYGIIIFIRIITIFFFFQGKFLTFKFCILIYIIFWIRSTRPRFRYDKLINLAWISLLPRTLTLFTLNFLLFI